VTAAAGDSDRVPIDAPRHLRRMVVDFSSLHLPAALSRALADAADKACEIAAVVRASARETDFADSVCEIERHPG
jgi:hypothetical protein